MKTGNKGNAGSVSYTLTLVRKSPSPDGKSKKLNESKGAKEPRLEDNANQRVKITVAALGGVYFKEGLFRTWHDP